MTTGTPTRTARPPARSRSTSAYPSSDRWNRRSIRTDMAKLDVSMTPDEVDAYLAEGRTVRLATAAADGTPHAVPLWYVWQDGAMYLNTTLGNVTVENIER